VGIYLFYYFLFFLLAEDDAVYADVDANKTSSESSLLLPLYSFIWR